MPNRFRARKADEVLWDPIAALLGVDVVLPDGTTIRARIKKQERTDLGDGLTQNVHSVITWGEIPTRLKGTLAAETNVTIGGVQHYVPAIGENRRSRMTWFSLEPLP